MFRREGVRLAKAEHEEFSNLFFSNSVTQSTRVRIDILKALAKKLTTASEVAYVQGFQARPALQYRVKDGERSQAEGVGRSYNFVDSVLKFGSLLTSKDLATAYTRAGDTFKGAMSQYFVVLQDVLVNAPRGVRTGTNLAPLGTRGARGPGSRGGRSRGAVRPGPSHARRLSPELLRGVKRTGDCEVSTPSKRKEENINEPESNDQDDTPMN